MSDTPEARVSEERSGGAVILLEDSALSAMVRAGDEAATNEPRLPEHHDVRSIAMPDDTANAVGADSATLAHNMGVNSHEINGQPAWAKALSDAHARRAAERGDNWQHISSPVARVVANVLRKMGERDDE